MQPGRKFTLTLLAANTRQIKKECVAMQHVTKLKRMDGWGGEQAQQCSQEVGARRGRWGLWCVSVFERYCFGSGRCGSARSNTQAGCAQAHTAAVPVLWDNVQLAKSAELRPSSLLASLRILFCRIPTCAKSYLFRKSERCLHVFSFLSWDVENHPLSNSSGSYGQKKRQIMNQNSIGGKQC